MPKNVGYSKGSRGKTKIGPAKRRNPRPKGKRKGGRKK